MTSGTPPQILKITKDHFGPLQVEDLTHLEENQQISENGGHQSERNLTGRASGEVHATKDHVDMEQFVQWISDYELPDDSVMPKNVSTYKGQGDPDLRVWTFEGAIKTCAWNDPIACRMPHPLLSGNRKGERKFCKFHNDHEYDTNFYRELKKEIEKVINQGKLDHLLQGVKKTIANALEEPPSHICMILSAQPDSIIENAEDW
ncbi:hypothetical protein Tco_0287214 [Tanacetum coccineum]